MNFIKKFSVMFVISVLHCILLSGFVMGYVGEEEGVLGEVDVHVPVPGSNVKGGVSGCHLTSDDPDADCIPGRGGADYPLHWQVPPTHFQCTGQLYPGYYADTESQCQVFHICQFDGRQDSFLCPNGTVFNQKYFTCEWWYNVNCAEAQSHYVLNAYLYQEPSVSLVQQPGSLPPALPVAQVPVTPAVSGQPSPPTVTIVQRPSLPTPQVPVGFPSPPTVPIVQQPSPVRPGLPTPQLPAGLPSPPSVAIVQEPSPLRPGVPVAQVPVPVDPPTVPIVQEPSPLRPGVPVSQAPVPVGPPSIAIVQQPSPVRPSLPTPQLPAGLPSPPTVAIVQEPSPLRPGVPVGQAPVPVGTPLVPIVQQPSPLRPGLPGRPGLPVPSVPVSLPVIPPASHQTPEQPSGTLPSEPLDY